MGEVDMHLQTLKKSVLHSFFIGMVILSLGSCDETQQSRVGIQISPRVPIVGNFEFETDEETVTPNWFGFVLSFSNPTSQRLILQKVTASYRIGSQKEFVGATELDEHSDQEGSFFLDVAAGASGEEYVHLPKVSTSFVRYLFNLKPDSVAPRNLNYYVKFEFAGYFTEDDTSDNPIPTERFEKTIFFRTKASNN